MRDSLFLLALLCVLAATTAQAAGGVCLRWDKCFSETGAATNKNFACDSDAGSQLLVGSFYPPTAINQVTRVSAQIDLAAASAALPAWWQFSGCRIGSLSVNATADPANLACEDWSVGLASASVTSFTVNTAGPHTARISLTSTVPGAGAQSLVAFLDYFAFNLTLDNLGTVGGAACAGCATPVCIALNQLNVVHGGPAPMILNTPANGTDSHYVTWQGGGAPISGTVTACPALTPARNTTWGAVKSLYR